MELGGRNWGRWEKSWRRSKASYVSFDMNGLREGVRFNLSRVSGSLMTRHDVAGGSYLTPSNGKLDIAVPWHDPTPKIAKRCTLSLFPHEIRQPVSLPLLGAGFRI